MNAFWIKVIAILTMLVDHFALFYFPDSFPLQIIGRLSFPLIAWLIANGAVYTKNIDRYLIRLGIFAFLAQIPYEVGFYMSGTPSIFFNVLFTLFFGLLAIRIMQFSLHPYVRTLLVGACVAAAGILHADYGVGGVLSILAFHIYYDRPKMMVLSQIVILMFLTNLRFFIGPGYGFLVMHPLEEWAVLALPVILLYNKRRGYATGLFFYWFFVIQAALITFLHIRAHR
jgi:hypothetical protein